MLLAEQKRREAENLKSQAASTVEMHENHLLMIVTLHLDAADPPDWPQVIASAPPPPAQERENQARRALESYRPSIFERLFGGAKRRRAELEAAIPTAHAQDEAAHREALEHWNQYQQTARGIVQGDLQAYQVAIESLSPFGEIEGIGGKVETRVVERTVVEASVTVPHTIVPTVEQKLLASGKLSTKEMPKAKYWGFYQEYVCSAAIRVARELFHLLPVERVFVDVGTVRLNTATGHMDNDTFLSVEFDRRRLLGLNFDRLDPSDAVQSFTHRMEFKKSSGFTPIQPLQALAQLTSL
ncbi:MAG TPA: hypothetical protein VHO06_18925 [Polyangia bacterium]|nr:hypothetical protein [Polyangia bacterium]